MIDLHEATYQQSFEISGEWWVASNSRYRVNGTLFVNGYEKVELQLFGALPKWLSPGHHAHVERQTILGQADGGRLISLHNCYSIRTDGTRVTYDVGIAVVNAHVRKLTSLRFESVFISLT